MTVSRLFVSRSKKRFARNCDERKRQSNPESILFENQYNSTHLLFFLEYSQRPVVCLFDNKAGLFVTSCYSPSHKTLGLVRYAHYSSLTHPCQTCAASAKNADSQF